MKNIKARAAIIMAAALAGAGLAAGAEAKTGDASAAPAGVMVPGMAVANLQAAVAQSSAFKTAEEQRKVTYKAQFDAAQARRAQINAKLKPLIEQFNKDRANSKTPPATLQSEAGNIRAIEQDGNAEIQKILAPVGRSRAYVAEQIESKVPQAVQNAMAKQKVTAIFNSQAMLAFNNAYNLTPAIVQELNALLPSAQLVPPAGWQPKGAHNGAAAAQ